MPARCAPAHVVDEALWCRLKDELRATVTRWNAYTSGRLVQAYKRAGGKFRGRKGAKPLAKWYAEKWVDLSRPLASGGYAPCGRSQRQGGYPLCRPAKVAARIPPEKAREWVRQKRAAGGAAATMLFPAPYRVTSRKRVSRNAARRVSRKRVSRRRTSRQRAGRGVR